MSYANAARKDTFPSANQAIIFPYIEDAPTPYYAKKMVNIIGNNVLHCAKISNNRIRMYIKTREIAENFLASGGEIEINNNIIKARWYKEERNDKRIIISNVPPHVPHEEITKVMLSHDVTPSSPMKFLKLSQEEGLTNILSERRFVYIPTEAAGKLPPSEIVKFGEDEYRVFYNDAQIKCFVCHQFGHTTQTCEYNKKPEETELSPSNVENSTENDLTKSIQGQPNKRPLSTSTQSTSSAQIDDVQQTPVTTELTTENTDIFSDKPNVTSPPKKKSKKSSKTKKAKIEKEPVSIKEQLKHIEQNFKEHEKKYPISFSNFQLMMDMLKGESEPFPIISQFTDDIDGVIQILEQNYPFLTTRTMKTRFTRLKNKISNKSAQSEEDMTVDDETTDEDMQT